MAMRWILAFGLQMSRAIENMGFFSTLRLLRATWFHSFAETHSAFWKEKQ